MTKMDTVILLFTVLYTVFSLECYVNDNDDMRTDDGFELCVFEPPNLEDVQSTSKMYGIDAFVGKNLHMKQYKNFLKKTNEGHSFISVCSNEISDPFNDKINSLHPKVVCFCSTNLCNVGDDMDSFLKGQQLRDKEETKRLNRDVEAIKDLEIEPDDEDE